MKKASKILLLIGGLFGIIGAVLLLLGAVGLFLYLQGVSIFEGVMGIGSILVSQEILPIDIFGSIFSMGLEGGIITTVYGVILMVFSYVLLVALLVSFIINLIAGIIALKSRGKNEKKGLYIANFVFAGIIFLFFGGNWIGYIAIILNIVGSILGLIAMKKAKEAEAQPEAEEAKVEVVE